MNIWFILLAISLANINLSLANNDEDEDSSEYGVVDGDVGTNCTCGFANKEGERIVGGVEAKRNEWPMIAEFAIDKSKHLCAGTVVTKRHIVTAAHCGFFPKSLKKLPYHRFTIYLGIHEVEGERAFADGQERTIDQFIAHPEYSPTQHRNDIAVILLNADIEFTKNVGPACLPLGNEKFDGEYLKVLGWGKPSGSSKKGTPALMKVNLKAIGHKLCKRIYRSYYEDSHICAYERNKDSCGGDSGGPLLWRDPETNRYVLVAVTSFGGGSCKGPAVNSNVMWFLPWIQKTIAETDSRHRTCSKVSS
ncbi:hypothetical protein O3M35_009852 [Rhynocoris fuscipes]|uniref:Peptidase S1 domain-containing protein n=1 Tax=Rhynocoris fuscipes TaxID=488301 RepID=A0AAW1D4I4_9HEMI